IQISATSMPTPAATHNALGSASSTSAVCPLPLSAARVTLLTLSSIRPSFRPAREWKKAIHATARGRVENPKNLRKFAERIGVPADANQAHQEVQESSQVKQD